MIILQIIQGRTLLVTEQLDLKGAGFRCQLHCKDGGPRYLPLHLLERHAHLFIITNLHPIIRCNDAISSNDMQMVS